MLITEDFLKKHLPSVIGEDLYFSPPVKKKKNAVKAYGQKGKVDQVIALFDATIFGSATEGILFTSQGFISNVFDEKLAIDYDEIVRAEYFQERNSFFICIKKGMIQEIKTFNSTIKWDQFEEFVNRIALNFKNYDADPTLFEKVLREPEVIETEGSGIKVWHILGGAALGVGAVAAAPFTGGGSVVGAATLASSLAGAGTIATAVGAGTVGAAAAHALSKDDEEDITEKAEVEYLLKIQEYEKRLNKAFDLIRGNAQFFDSLLALEAVGFAIAACDGEISQEEQVIISTYARGANHANYPLKYKKMSEDLHRNPPSVREAFHMAKNSGLDLSLFNDLIRILIEADGVEHESELVFEEAWFQLANDA